MDARIEMARVEAKLGHLLLQIIGYEQVIAEMQAEITVLKTAARGFDGGPVAATMFPRQQMSAEYRDPSTWASGYREPVTARCPACGVEGPEGSVHHCRARLPAPGVSHTTDPSRDPSTWASGTEG